MTPHVSKLLPLRRRTAAHSLRTVRSLLRVLLSVALLSASAAHADVASDWVGLADRAIDGQPVAPPLRAQRERIAPALTALAIFEAVNSIDRRYHSYLDLPKLEGSASEHAAAVAAGHGVLATLYPERQSTLDDAFALALAHIPDGPSKEAGLALGRRAAQAALSRPMFEGPAPEPDRPAGEEPYHPGPVEVASETPGPAVTMVFPDWTAFRDAASLARIQGGMHFRFSNEAGQAMGRRIAEIAQERFAPLITADP